MRRIQFSALRKYVPAAGAAVIIGAAVAKFGLGTYCSVCPLGFAQIAAASRSVPVDMLAGVVTVTLAVLVLGRFFCGWLCTTVLVRNMFLGTGHVNTHNGRSGGHNSNLSKLPYIFLLLAVGLSFFAKFPVFCLVCPIGLFFGFIFAGLKMIYDLEPSWNLIIFPAILAAELLIFRKWCVYVCPVSAVFKLLAKVPFIKLRPAVNRSTCITCGGGTCSVCSEQCPEGIKVTEDGKNITEICTNCLECADKCPSGSIHYFKKNPQ